ncbi:unnamed protein product [Paramecium primaurelia]|uniref:Uncharacterized protein n=1 Tax=Paramecium primaurelia TaxID=5886 RepID=A0A8S1Q1Y2_PARPR|nr:unnamed protein product [Paramecium primaurelia]
MQLIFDNTQIHKSPEQLRREKLDIKIKTIKADLAPGVVKYMMKTKNNQKLQTPLHNVEYHHPYSKPQLTYLKTFQKMDLEPPVQLDEIKEEKWSILSKNCRNILEKSRISLGKPNETQFLRRSSIELYPSPQKQIKNNNKFLTRRQSIDLRIEDIKSPQQSPVEQMNPSPKPLGIKMDPFYVRFKKYYKKIGIHQDEQPKPNNNKFQKLHKNSYSQDKIYKINSPQRQNQSFIFFPQVQCSPQAYNKSVFQKKKSQQQYLQDILALCNMAQHFQAEMKKDETENYSELNQKVEYIRSEFNKYHSMINNEQDSTDNIEIK